MPDSKGRKNKRRRDRNRVRDYSAEASDERTDTQPAPRPSAKPAPAAPGPSPTARVTGFMIAIVTAVLAALMVYGAITDDLSSVDSLVRVAAGVLLVLLAVAVGALALFSTQIAARFRRR